MTRDSVAMTLSFHTPENALPLFKEKSVIDVANDSGYQTYWLSSQQLEGLHDTRYGFLAQSSQIIEFTEFQDNKLPSLLNKALADNSHHKKFIVLHMIGSHIPYGDKYDSIDRKSLPNADEYDWSVHKTDRVIKEIVDILDTQPYRYSLFFASDHGELIGQGHGMLYGGPQQYLIPYFIVSHNTNLCGYIESLRSDNGYLNGIANKFVLLEMLGIEVDRNYIDAELKSDQVLHANGKVYQWEQVVVQDF
ncbi:hypothetical protein NURINAE_01044 [Candidatus Nitrosacidococcus sp. I8]|nr:hypothetical protein NURINAE_01044 [Candidatus Nitrosacidococcus sp. I8]